MNLWRRTYRLQSRLRKLLLGKLRTKPLARLPANLQGSHPGQPGSHLPSPEESRPPGSPPKRKLPDPARENPEAVNHASLRKNNLRKFPCNRLPLKLSNRYIPSCSGRCMPRGLHSSFGRPYNMYRNFPSRFAFAVWGLLKCNFLHFIHKTISYPFIKNHKFYTIKS